MLYHKSYYKLFSLLVIALLVCSCAKVAPEKPHFRHFTTQDFMKANIQAQNEQDDRLKRKSEELDRMHITGSEKTKQLAIEKIAAHKDFLRKLDENKKAIIEGITQRPQK